MVRSGQHRGMSQPYPSSGDIDLALDKANIAINQVQMYGEHSDHNTSHHRSLTTLASAVAKNAELLKIASTPDEKRDALQNLNTQLNKYSAQTDHIIKFHIGLEPSSPLPVRVVPTTKPPYPVGSTMVHSCSVNQYVGSFECSPTEQQCRDNSPQYCSPGAITTRIKQTYSSKYQSNQSHMLTVSAKASRVHHEIQALIQKMHDTEDLLRAQEADLEYVRKHGGAATRTTRIPDVMLLRHHIESHNAPQTSFQCKVGQRNIRLMCPPGGCQPKTIINRCAPAYIRSTLQHDISQTKDQLEHIQHNIQEAQESYETLQQEHSELRMYKARLRSDLEREMQQLRTPRGTPLPVLAVAATPVPSSCSILHCTPDGTCSGKDVCTQEQYSKNKICVDPSRALQKPVDHMCSDGKKMVFLDSTCRCVAETHNHEFCSELASSDTTESCITARCVDPRNIESLRVMPEVSCSVIHDGNMLCTATTQTGKKK